MKQLKILGILAIALTLGLAACNKPADGGNDNSDSTPSGEVEPCQDGKHKWGEKVTIKEPTCTEDGQSQRTCTVCGAKEEPKTIKAAHKWGEWVKQSDSTCVVAGKDQRECSVCKITEQRDRALAEHTYVQDTDQTDVAPDCTNTGTNYLKCSVCGDTTTQTVPALGHDYDADDDGEDDVVWTVNANCTTDGVGTKTCVRCNNVENVTEAKWGHKMATSETGEPEPGKAAVRVYDCQNPGCDQTYFGFKATETSPNAGRLVEVTDAETGEVGKRFWGRPIGNDVELDDEGTADRDNHDAVFNEETQGDLFEYVFDLTADQVAIMGDTVACYVDAAPADYLSGQDFWACDPSSEEWTRGYYIEGEKKGQPIDTYRYILYVDGHPVEFNPKMKAPVASQPQTNIPRGTYLMPYVFHFTAGSHSISLRMAGGYRSVFYNFTFRPYEVPADIPATPANIEIRQEETAQINCTVPGVTYASSNANVATVDANGLVTGVGVGTATITISKEGNYFPTEIPVKINEKAGVVVFEAEDTFTSDPADAIVAEPYAEGSQTIVLKTFPKDATYTKKFNQPDLAGKYNITMTGYGAIEDLAAAMSLKINNVAVALSGDFTSSEDSSGNPTAASKVIGQADLVLGENTMTITALGDAMPQIDSFRFDPAPAVPEHVHEWVNDSTVAGGDGKVGYTLAHCSGNDANRLQIAALDENKVFASGSSNKGGTPEPYLKLNSDGNSVTFTFNYTGTETAAKLVFTACMDGWGTNSNKSAGFYNGDSTRMTITVNGDDVDQSALKGKSYETLFANGTANSLGSSYSNVGEIEMGAVTLVNGVNTITLNRNVTLNPLVSHINIIF